MKKILLLLPSISLFACSSYSPPMQNNIAQTASNQAQSISEMNPVNVNVHLYSVSTSLLDKQNITDILKGNQLNHLGDEKLICFKSENTACKTAFIEQNLYVNKVLESQNSIIVSPATNISGIEIYADKLSKESTPILVKTKLISNYDISKNGVQQISTIELNKSFTLTPDQNIFVIKPSPTTNKQLFGMFNTKNSYIITIDYIPNHWFNFVGELKYNYEVSGNPKPLLVFNDSKRTYIKFASLDRYKMIVPTVDDNLVNYTLTGKYIIVDGVYSNITIQIDGNKIKVHQLQK